MNEKCPCKSGKKYKICCKDKNCTYVEFGLNYKGEKIIFSKEENELLLRDLKTIFDAISTKKYSDKESFVDDFRILYEKLDKYIEPFSTGSSCGKGCSTCCKLNIDVYPIEAMIINDYIDSHLSANEKQIIKSNIEKYESFYPNKSRNHEEISLFESKNIPCCFLSASDGCFIYDVRPFLCRIHFVFTNPSGCEIGNRSEKYIFPKKNEILALLENLSKYTTYNDTMICSYIGNYFKCKL